jgi:hypothetical protein
MSLPLLVALVPAFAFAAGVGTPSVMVRSKASPSEPFLFWKDYPGSAEYIQNRPEWCVFAGCVYVFGCSECSLACVLVCAR